MSYNVISHGKWTFLIVDCKQRWPKDSFVQIRLRLINQVITLGMLIQPIAGSSTFALKESLDPMDVPSVMCSTLKHSNVTILKTLLDGEFNLILIDLKQRKLIRSFTVRSTMETLIRKRSRRSKQRTINLCGRLFPVCFIQQNWINLDVKLNH